MEQAGFGKINGVQLHCLYRVCALANGHIVRVSAIFFLIQGDWSCKNLGISRLIFRIDSLVLNVNFHRVEKILFTKDSEFSVNPKSRLAPRSHLANSL